MDASLPPRRGRKGKDTLLASVTHGLLCALLLLPCLLLLGGIFAYRSDDPTALVKPLGYATAVLVAFFGGATAARRRKKQGLICGVLTGLALLAFLLLGFFICLDDSEPQLGRLLLSYLLLLVVSTVGGCVGGLLPAGGARRVRRPKLR